MSNVVNFEQIALARLRQRLGEAQEANQDLVAFARGHSGATAAIHRAILAATEAVEIEELLHVVTRDWPAILCIDHVALALVIDGQGFLAGADGVHPLQAALIDRERGARAQLVMRSVEHGNCLFGNNAADVRAEVLVGVDCGPRRPRGILALGQDTPLDIEGDHGAQLLQFLGESLGAMINRWLNTAPH